MKNNERLIWLNGKILELSKATINVLSPTAQFGLNVFEGIPCYWNEAEQQLYAFRLDDHIKRMLDSARLLEIDCPFAKEELKDSFINIIKANSFKEDIMVRQTLFVEGLGSWQSDSPCGMFISPIGRKELVRKEDSYKCCFSSWRRISDEDMSPRIKSGANYINSRLGQREAIRNGYDTCIFLNKNGTISEGPGSCFFMAKEGRLITPALSDNILNSITRDTILRIAEDISIKTEERSICRTEAYQADGAFLCGSSMEIKNIKSLDSIQIGGNELVNSMAESYMMCVRGNRSNRNNWLTPIYQ